MNRVTNAERHDGRPETAKVEIREDENGNCTARADRPRDPGRYRGPGVAGAGWGAVLSCAGLLEVDSVLPAACRPAE